MADAKRRQVSIDEAISQAGGEFGLAQKLQTAVVSFPCNLCSLQ